MTNDNYLVMISIGLMWCTVAAAQEGPLRWLAIGGLCMCVASIIGIVRNRNSDDGEGTAKVE